MLIQLLPSSTVAAGVRLKIGFGTVASAMPGGTCQPSPPNSGGARVRLPMSGPLYRPGCAPFLQAQEAQVPVLFVGCRTGEVMVAGRFAARVALFCTLAGRASCWRDSVVLPVCMQLLCWVLAAGKPR